MLKNIFTVENLQERRRAMVPQLLRLWFQPTNHRALTESAECRRNADGKQRKKWYRSVEQTARLASVQCLVVLLGAYLLCCGAAVCWGPGRPGPAAWALLSRCFDRRHIQQDFDASSSTTAATCDVFIARSRIPTAAAAAAVISASSNHNWASPVNILSHYKFCLVFFRLVFTCLW